MRRTFISLTLLAAVAVLLAGCEASKSSNPTSPSVAGPIPGVSITPPKLLEPGTNWSIPSTNQPVTLLIENASTNGQRAISYVFEIAADVEFGNKLFAREGVPPGDGGRTSLRLPDALASDRTYFWRARATDGANASSYSPAAAFSIVTPAVINPPTPLAPIGGITIATNRAEFVVRNSVKSGPTGQTNYIIEISQTETFVSLVAAFSIPETTVETRLSAAFDFAYSARFFWRVRAYDPNTTSPWSPTQMFVTPAAPAPPPPPTPTPTPSPGPTPSPSGWPKTGAEVVRWAETHYPSRLAGGISLSQRQDNMAFLRDRMIEAGICGGMDLGLNLKRGGPEISIDFLVHKSNGQDIGVDIGMDYDNTSVPLRIYWGAGAPGPYYKTYTPRPTCK